MAIIVLYFQFTRRMSNLRTSEQKKRDVVERKKLKRSSTKHVRQHICFNSCCIFSHAKKLFKIFIFSSLSVPHIPTGFWGLGEWHSRAWLCCGVIWSWGQVPFRGYSSQTGRSPRQAAPACYLEVKYLLSVFHSYYKQLSLTDVSSIFLQALNYWLSLTQQSWGSGYKGNWVCVYIKSSIYSLLWTHNQLY